MSEKQFCDKLVLEIIAKYGVESQWHITYETFGMSIVAEKVLKQALDFQVASHNSLKQVQELQASQQAVKQAEHADNHGHSRPKGSVYRSKRRRNYTCRCRKYM